LFVVDAKNTESHEVTEIEESSLRVARDWTTGLRDVAVSSGSSNSVPSEKKPAPWGPTVGLAGRLSENSSRHSSGEVVGKGQGKRNFPSGNIGSFN